jgi:CBS domain-containing protein
MRVGEYCVRDVVVVSREESIREAVRLMRKYHVGDVVVVDSLGGQRRPVGILTDRDIVIELLAAGVDLDAVAIGDAMSFRLLTARESDDLGQTLGRMRERGVRRVPVVADDGTLAGILAADDVIEIVAAQLSDLAQLIARGHARERQTRP